MNKTLRVFAIATLVLGSLLLPTRLQRPASAAGETTIILASLAPKDSDAGRALIKWDKALQAKTQGRVKFFFARALDYGDERDILKKIQANQLHGATLTSVGLGQLVRSVSVLQVPGLFKGYQDLNAARTAMDADWRKQFDTAGYQLLGWFDIGFARIFSAKPIAKPADLKTVRPWIWADDPVFPKLLEVVGVTTGRKLNLGEVITSLSTKMIDTVTASPTVAMGLRFYDTMPYMTKQADTALVGATLITNKIYKSLPPDAQQALVETGKAAHAEVASTVAAAELKNTADLKGRGVKEVDTAPFAAEWNQAYVETRTKLVGRLYTKDLLDRVIAATAQANGAK